MNRVRLYVPGDSFLHRLHPSTKLALYVAFFIIIYAVDWPIRWVIAFTVFLAMWFSGITPGKYKGMLFVTMMATLTVPLLNGLWANDKDPIILRLVGDFGFHKEGLTTGLDFAGLYTAVGVITMAVLTTVQLWELAEAPTLLGAPHVIGFSLAYIFRYMPEVVDHYFDLSDVWRTRGVNFKKGKVWQKFWLQARLLTTLLILEFSRVSAKSNAIESRGFSVNKKGVSFILPAIPKGELLLIVISYILAAVTLVIRLIIFIHQRWL